MYPQIDYLSTGYETPGMICLWVALQLPIITKMAETQQ